MTQGVQCAFIVTDTILFVLTSYLLFTSPFEDHALRTVAVVVGANVHAAALMVLRSWNSSKFFKAATASVCGVLGGGCVASWVYLPVSSVATYAPFIMHGITLALLFQNADCLPWFRRLRVRLKQRVWPPPDDNDSTQAPTVVTGAVRAQDMRDRFFSAHGRLAAASVYN